MMNIREAKGYTYNIFSSMDTMLYDGYFYVGTEVDNRYAEKTIEEIYSEMERLKVDLVDDIELEMVKNYLMGNLLTMIDGPMNSSEVVKAFLINKLPFNSFNHLIYKIQTIEAEELRTLAVKYLNRESMWEVVSGGVNN
jgi:predicted Zn-dependent peptidase